MNQWDLIMFNHCWKSFKADVIIRWNAILTANYLMCLPIIATRERWEQRKWLSCCALYRCPLRITGIWSTVEAPAGLFTAHLSLFPSFSLLCLRVDHSYTCSPNDILGAVIHKQLKEAQIIWSPAPLGIASCGCGFAQQHRVDLELIEAILITCSHSLPTAPAFFCKLSMLSSGFICPAEPGNVNKLASGIQTCVCGASRHLWSSTQDSELKCSDTETMKI